MKKSKEYYLPTDESNQLFKDHLNIPGNDRIVFSAKFGDGKTTFLNHFFKDNSEEFEAIHLYPVHYSIATNEDIFELIKYDIFFRLLANGNLNFEKIKESFIDCIKDYAKENRNEMIKLFTPALRVIPRIGSAIEGVTDKLIDHGDALLKKYSQKAADEKDSIVEYLDEYNYRTGSLYEENYYTKLISALVCRLKESEVSINTDDPDNSKNLSKIKKVILIIDDLDRIDPGHIFRILNIFAAHQDTVKTGNKFDFDKVLVVCDINNIRSIFHHKYGSDTDFNGYIDKFYSSDVFNYSMKQLLLNYTNELLTEIEGNKFFETFYDPTTIFFEEIQWLIKSFIINDIINIRNVVKFWDRKLIIHTYNIGIKKHKNYHLWGIIVFNILKRFFGDYYELKKAFGKFRNVNNEGVENRNELDTQLNYLLLPIIAAQNNLESGTFNEIIPQRNSSTKYELEVDVSYSSEGRGYDFLRTIINKDVNTTLKELIPNIDINDFYYRCFEIAFNESFLK